MAVLANASGELSRDLGAHECAFGSLRDEGIGERNAAHYMPAADDRGGVGADDQAHGEIAGALRSI